MSEPRQFPPQPIFGANNYVAETATVCGDVTFGDDCSVWPAAVIRADVAAIRIGHRVNVQDGTIIHTRHEVTLDIEDDVAFGHRAVAHCRRIGRRTLVGIGAILLDGCEIGESCLIAAGAVLRPGTLVPDGKLVAGVPAKVLRDITEEERSYLGFVVDNYLRLSRRHRCGEFPRSFPT